MDSLIKYFLLSFIFLFSSFIHAQDIEITSKGSYKKITPEEDDYFSIAISLDSIPFEISNQYYRGEFLKDSASFLILKPTYAFSLNGDKRTSNSSKNMGPLTFNKDQIYGIEYWSKTNRKLNYLSKSMMKFSIIAGLVLAPAFSYDFNQKELNTKRYFEYLGVSLGTFSVSFITKRLTKKKNYYFKENEKGKKIWSFQ